MVNKNAVVSRLVEPEKYLTLGPTVGVLEPLRVPSDFLYSVLIPDLPAIEIGGIWDGDRLRVTRLLMNLASGLTATHLIKIKLPELVSAVGVDAIPHSELWSSGDSYDAFPPQGKQDQYSRLAQVYWFHHLTWGAPRQKIMEITGWSRNNTNFHLRQISKVVELPSSRDSASSRQLRSQKG